MKGNNILMKMNTCNDLSTNVQEESSEVERYEQLNYFSTDKHLFFIKIICLISRCLFRENVS